MYMKLRKLTNTGDTIVEVLVVTAVLGLTLSISFATASRSLLNTRRAQESSQASDLVQSQIEVLRTMTGNHPMDPNYIFKSGPYCVSGTSSQPYKLSTGSDCNGINTFYNLADTYDNSSHTLTVAATWADVIDGTNDSVTMYYRLYK